MTSTKRLNIVLFEPEIAQNVGAIIRTCVAVNAKLHIIEPLGFIFDSRFVTRSSANYIEYADYQLYNDWDHFVSLNPMVKLYCATRYAKFPHSKVDFANCSDPIFILFGRESTGIPTTILKANLERCFRIPMSEHVRSLNIANTVGIVAYEVMRQLDYPDLSQVEIQKGTDYLE
ncbi:tRNA (cytidine(34)-2'-O)-methyltransferase [Spiroplasma chrysopicola]|uniref:Putative tRNA (cytidine(34)-2'-O)-methyltransferase n=1 Tax=Spiroplasma chrysopicola DF-1 TaxID=1276227 RepID=R4U0Z1_9MOLU|nr:tRNA (cytidine(34)-2'-O)-methyltransferase [Spiroplasma chrysopicola]AGM24977.1 RNA methyltransferase [Spiroplasma chrysopicola DF-1]